jgi:DNA-binding CsgD family transcriptional regulator
MNSADAEKILVAVAEEVELAAFGLSSWSNVGQRLTEGFPGSSCVILNEDRSRQTLSEFTCVNIEQHHMDAYAEYFAFRNPWIKVWSRFPNRICAVSERDFPVSQLANTEYYNDFLKWIPDFDASAGLSLDIDPSSTFRIPIHYSVANAEKYDPWAEWILTRLQGVLKRSVEGLSSLQDQADRAIAKGALVNRGDMLAVVVDAEMTLFETNSAASDALARGYFICQRQGRFSFSPQKLNQMVAVAVRSLASSATSPVSSATWTNDVGSWVISFSLVAGSRLNPFVSPRPLVLIQAKDVSTAPSKPVKDFARLFRLTPAEEVFCRHLIAGNSLKDIALATGIAFETARFRLRSIFQKTDTHRQGELIALLHRFVGP